jgi:hypothetical protein
LELALRDLRYYATDKQTVAETARFLCRSEKEVAEKAAQLGLKLAGM